jgi:hypothetical protein
VANQALVDLAASAIGVHGNRYNEAGMRMVGL